MGNIDVPDRLETPVALPRPETTARPRAAAIATSAFWPAIAGEYIGTFALVFFGVGVVNAAVITGVQVGLWQVAVVWAVGVTLGIYCSAMPRRRDVAYRTVGLPASRTLAYSPCENRGRKPARAAVPQPPVGSAVHPLAFDEPVRGRARNLLAL